MRMIFMAMILMFTGTTMAQVSPESDKPPSAVIEVAKEYGFSPGQVYRANRDRKKKVDVDAISFNVTDALETNKILAAEYADEALENLLRRADGVLRKNGQVALANDIATDYSLFYRGGFVSMAFGEKEMGDHPPMSEWIDKTHMKIEKAIGDFWCKFWHFHDLFILNYGLPVVWNPSKYDLPDYKDHFSGHLIGGFFWEHHGVAGVISYWVIEGVCSGFTGGVGLVAFACTPIASFGEHITDKHLAPPVAERIWKASRD